MNEMNLTTNQMFKYDLAKKSVGFAYILGFIFGMLGVHCFYCKQTEHGLARLLLCVLSLVIPPLYFVCVVVFLADFFLTKGWVDEYNQKILATIVE